MSLWETLIIRTMKDKMKLLCSSSSQMVRLRRNAKFSSIAATMSSGRFKSAYLKNSNTRTIRVHNCKVRYVYLRLKESKWLNTIWRTYSNRSQFFIPLMKILTIVCGWMHSSFKSTSVRVALVRSTSAKTSWRANQSLSNTWVSQLSRSVITWSRKR